MRKVIISSMCILALASCTKDVDNSDSGVNYVKIDNHAQSVLGSSFDINQDYNMLSTGEVSIVADVDESVGYNSGAFEVSKVQILTGNPFYQDDVQVINEMAARQGETVTLTYDAPKSLTTLYAAVVSTDNRYRVKAFSLSDTRVSFGSAANRAARRAKDGTTSTAEEVETPKVTSAGKWSCNRGAVTDTKFVGHPYWVNSYWCDKLYDMSATIEALPDFTTEERAEVDGVIERFTPEEVDNRNAIKQSEFYINTANYFTATQEAKPIKVTFVHSGASVIDSEKLYYYYFDPARVEGMTDEERAEFMEGLPKYCLINCKDTRYAEPKASNWKFTKQAFKYTLAYFGDDQYPANGTEGTYEFPAGYKIGFMLSMRNGNWTVELYADSLLNNEINYFDTWGVANMGQNMSRAAIFGANGKNYVGFEDLKDNDFNDVVFQVEGGVEIIDESKLLDKGVYTYAFEDTEVGDYDMNDVVIKAQRQDATHVKFSLEATGAWDELYIKTSGGLNLGKLQDTEVHELFGVGVRQFVNTEKNATHVAPIQETVVVPSNFSFGVLGRKLYIYNKTKNIEVKLAEKGEDPHGILIPYDWKYPLEKMCITNAYLKFNNWGANRIDDTDWYKYPEDKAEDHVYMLSVFE